MKQRYFTVKSAADRLEMARSTVKYWCQSGQLPAIKFGKLWKIPVEVVEARIEQATKGRGSLLLDARN